MLEVIIGFVLGVTLQYFLGLPLAWNVGICFVAAVIHYIAVKTRRRK